MASTGFLRTAQQSVAALPTMTPQDLPEDSRSCPICLENYGQASSDQVAEEAVKLPCNHISGSRCLKLWLDDGNTCPHCRYQIFQRSNSPESDRVSITHSEHTIPSDFDYGESDDFDEEFVDGRAAGLRDFLVAPSSSSGGVVLGLEDDDHVDDDVVRPVSDGVSRTDHLDGRDQVDPSVPSLTSQEDQRIEHPEEPSSSL